MSFDPVWEKVFSQRDWGKYPNEQVIRFIARNFYQYDDRKNIKILEIGCGPGANLWFISREGFSVYGIDGSVSAIEQCKKRLNHESTSWKGELHVGDMTKLPFENETLDAVIDCEALYCNSFLESQKIIKEAYRVLKNKGLFLSITFAKGCIGDETGQKIEENYYYPSEGPFKDMGPARFTSSYEVEKLYSPFEISEIEVQTRSINNMKDFIKELVIIGKKVFF